MIKRFNQINESFEDFKEIIEEYFIDFVDSNMLYIQLSGNNMYKLFFDFNLPKPISDVGTFDLFIQGSKYIEKIKLGIERLKKEFSGVSVDAGLKLNYESLEDVSGSQRLIDGKWIPVNYTIEITNKSSNKFKITQSVYNSLFKNGQDIIDVDLMISFYKVFKKLNLEYIELNFEKSEFYIEMDKRKLIIKDRNWKETEFKGIEDIDDEILRVMVVLNINESRPHITISLDDDYFLIHESYNLFNKHYDNYYKVDKKSILSFLNERYNDLVKSYKNYYK